MDVVDWPLEQLMDTGDVGPHIALVLVTDKAPLASRQPTVSIATSFDEKLHAVLGFRTKPPDVTLPLAVPFNGQTYTAGPPKVTAVIEKDIWSSVLKWYVSINTDTCTQDVDASTRGNSTYARRF